MSKIRKMQVLIAMKFLSLKSTKFYSSEIKWDYSIYNNKWCWFSSWDKYCQQKVYKKKEYFMQYNIRV